MRTLSIDIETFSSVQLTTAGVYRYADHPDFDLLLFGYSVDGGPVEVADLANSQTIPDGGVLHPAQWHCTMIWSAYLGLPTSLNAVAAVLKLDVQRDSAGKKLIKPFCTPAKPSVLNGAA